MKNFNLNTYINFLTANGNRYSSVEASRALQNTPSHDGISRWLKEASFEPDDLWKYAKPHVALTDTCLVIDDTTLDKRWSPKNELVLFHWSGNEHKTIRGISLVNLMATGDNECMPVDYRVYEGKEKITKNDHFQNMLSSAKERCFKPDYVLADSWYSSLENMKFIQKLGWKFIIGLKENRLVNEIQGQYVSVCSLDWTKHSVRKVWLKGFGFVLVARIVFNNGDTRYVTTNDLTLTDYENLSEYSKKRWKIEEFHRGIKQTTGIEKCYSILKKSQLNHIFASFIAFIRLEVERLKSGISWYEQKARLVRRGIFSVFA